MVSAVAARARRQRGPPPPTEGSNPSIVRPQLSCRAGDSRCRPGALYNPVDGCTRGIVVDCLPVETTGWTNPLTNLTTIRCVARKGRIDLTDSAFNRTTIYGPDHGYAVDSGHFIRTRSPRSFLPASGPSAVKSSTFQGSMTGRRNGLRDGTDGRSGARRVRRLGARPMNGQRRGRAAEGRPHVRMPAP